VGAAATEAVGVRQDGAEAVRVVRKEAVPRLGLGTQLQEGSRRPLAEAFGSAHQARWRLAARPRTLVRS
jgi:hypothetical protein